MGGVCVRVPHICGCLVAVLRRYEMVAQAMSVELSVEAMDRQESEESTETEGGSGEDGQSAGC